MGKRAAVDWDRIKADIRSGLSASAVGKAHGIAHTTITRHQERHPHFWSAGIGADYVRPPGPPGPPPAPPPPPAPAPPSGGEWIPRNPRGERDVLLQHQADLQALATIARINRSDIAECQRLINEASTRITKATQRRAAIQAEQRPPVDALRDVDLELRTLTEQRDAITARLQAAEAIAKLLASNATTTTAVQAAERRAHGIVDAGGGASVQLLTIIQQITGRDSPSNAVTMIQQEADKRGRPAVRH